MLRGNLGSLMRMRVLLSVVNSWVGGAKSHTYGQERHRDRSRKRFLFR